MITCLGSGRKSNPYRYCLPEKLRDWEEDPLFRLMEDDRAFAEKLGLN